MTKNLDKHGLKAIADKYDLFYIDLWGVVHNGIKLHKNAISVLKELLNLHKDFVLLTNAPRPTHVVTKQLEKMGMEKVLRDHVFTSGQAALTYLKKFYSKKYFFHVGPLKDIDLFIDFKELKSNRIEDCEYLLCTGLFEDHFEDLNYYKILLENSLERKMICTNPDLIVDKGNKREMCAGSIAMIFEKMGGEVIYFGKPYPEVYNQSFDNQDKKILSIGDNLNTDIKGANLLNYDSLLITEGIHKKEIKDRGIIEVSKGYEVLANYTQTELKW